MTRRDATPHHKRIFIPSKEEYKTMAANTASTTNKHIPGISADTLTLIGMFRNMKPGDLITKKDAQRAIGRDPTGLVGTALKRVLRDDSILIEWDRDQKGWRRMEGSDNLTRRRSGISSLRRRSRREVEKLSVVDFGQLTDPQKVEAAATASIMGAIAHLGTGNSVKRIEQSIVKADVVGLPIGKTLALFHDGGGGGQ